MTTVNDDTFVVLPAYNESRKIREVVAGVVAMYPNVVVVDDGSSDETAAEARAGGAVSLRHVVNRGQGASLQTGIDFALRRGARFIVTFDSDGQHEPADIAALLAPLREGRADVTLGSRFRGTTDAMPRGRRLLLRAAVIFTRVMSRAQVTDTHNGLRAFTREAAARLDIRLDRMAHASEILDQIVRGGWRYEEVPVHIRYTGYSLQKGQSAFGAARVLMDYLWGKWLR
jgi:glycosyltransferase involved in cell wall biosynthesis